MTTTDNPQGGTPAPVLRMASLARTPEESFAIFTEQIGAWWPLPTHGVFGDRSGGVRFVDQKLVESSVDGDEAVWAEVTAWEPPARLELAWHPGQSDAQATRVEITFEADNTGTLVCIRHDGWETFGVAAVERRRNYIGPSAWGYVLDQLGDVSEPRGDGADLSALTAAYQEFFAEAERGGFGLPSDGGWTAEQVVAHVALNDLAMVGVSQALIHQGQPTFENHTCQDRDNLSRVIDRCDDLEGLTSFGRACASMAVAVLGRLNPDQREHLVPCRMEHDGEVVMDDVRPWEAIASAVQAGMHLPAHVQQLQNLRR